MMMMKNMAKECKNGKNALRVKGNGMTPSGNIMQTSRSTTDKYIHLMLMHYNTLKYCTK